MPLEDLELCSALNNAFPMLEVLSLSIYVETQPLLHNIAAPNLRALHLRDVVLSRDVFPLTKATNLLSLRLELMRFIPPNRW